jgi:site-specific recombinase XerD
MDTNLEGCFHLYKQFATAEGKSPRTIESYIDDVTGFAEFLGGCPNVKQTTAEDLRRYIIYLQNRDPHLLCLQNIAE